MLTKRRIGFAMAIAVILALGGIAAYASIPSPNGVVNGCYSNSAVNGVHGLGVMDSTGTCPTGTTALNWNQTGPQGPPGASGYIIVSQQEPNSCQTSNVGCLNPLVATCPSGHRVLGGGQYGGSVAYEIPAASFDPTHPTTADGNGWTVYFGSINSFPTSLTVYAVCAAVTT